MKESCATCRDRITGQEWQVCESCGEKFRQYPIPRSPDTTLMRVGITVMIVGAFLFVASLALGAWP